MVSGRAAKNQPGWSDCPDIKNAVGYLWDEAVNGSSVHEV